MTDHEVYVSIPREVEAMQYTGGNINEVQDFGHPHVLLGPNVFEADAGTVRTLWVITPSGSVQAYPGAWLLRRDRDDVWPVHDEIFRRTYRRKDGSD